MHIDAAWLRELDRRAVDETRRVLSGVVDFDVVTPCAGWSLGDLLAHMTVQQRGFAAAARGTVTAAADWSPRELAVAPVADYATACADVLAAFAAVVDPGSPMLLPEIGDTPVPAGIALGFHLVDNVVHAWDVAVSIGAAVAFDADVLGAALRVAEAVPDGASREREGAAFAPALPVPVDAGALERTLRLLGRDPAWTAPPLQ